MLDVLFNEYVLTIYIRAEKEEKMSEFRNGANDLKSVIKGLYLERDVVEEKIKHTKALFRWIDLSENYTSSIFKKDYTKNDLVSFCNTIMVDDVADILASRPKFAKALYNGLNHHKIHTVWTEYFNIFDVELFSKEEIENLLKTISKESNLIKSKSDHEMIEKLIDYVIGFKIDEVVNNSDLKSSLSENTFVQ